MANVDEPPAGGGGAGATGDAAKPVLNPAFAVVAGVLLAFLASWVLWSSGMLDGQAGLDDTAWKDLDSRGKLAANSAAAMAGLGIIVVLIGVWMAAVEWFGAFELKKGKDGIRTRAGADIPGVIQAIGKLKGAALVVVAGSLLMLSAAWVTSSAASPEPAGDPPAGDEAGE